MKKNIKKLAVSMFLVVLMTVSFSVTAFAAEFTGDSASATQDYNYKVVEKEVYTDFSGAVLNWSVPILKYTKTDVRTWNTDTLRWEQSYTESNAQEVTFTLANRGSSEVTANVSYASEIDGASSVTYGKKDSENNTINTNGPTLATIVNDDNSLKVTQGEMSDADFATAKSAYITNNCTATISGTVSLVPAQLSATSGKLGTYTVTISKPSRS